MLPELLVWCVQLCWWCISFDGKIQEGRKTKLNNSFAIFIYVYPVWCGCGVKCAMYLLFVCLYFCFYARMKAENLRIPKLSLLLHLGDSKPELWDIKHDRFFFFRHPVCTPLSVHMLDHWKGTTSPTTSHGGSWKELHPITKICRLWICEKAHILFQPEDITLNQRSEFFSKCWHKD